MSKISACMGVLTLPLNTAWQLTLEHVALCTGAGIEIRTLASYEASDMLTARPPLICTFFGQESATAAEIGIANYFRTSVLFPISVL